MLSLLSHPSVYLSLQAILGAKRARRKCIEEIVRPLEGQRILDIGCGPGYVVEYLPRCDYVGFDIEERYIAYAKRTYGSRGRFHCRELDDKAVAELGAFDLVIMNGLLHHLSDEDVTHVLGLGLKALKPGGRAISLDGCYVPGQSSIARVMLDRDRGRFVRTEAEYTRLAATVFKSIRAHIRHDMFYIPYTLAIMEMSV